MFCEKLSGVLNGILINLAGASLCKYSGLLA
jgi:hypothetical protein